MFQKFTQQKTRYDQGQIFPFLIAILCVVLIMIMITLNLGQIGIFKTEVSNAADAGALAGASVLSGTLLGFGMRSENMAGYWLTTMIWIAVEILIGIATSGYGLIIAIIAAIMTYITYLVEEICDYYEALGDGYMAWTNAKKTALQYAFSNVQLEEQRPTFEEAMQHANIPMPNSPAGIKYWHDIYYQGYDSHNPERDLRYYTQTGFNRFMQDTKRGYWNKDVFGDIQPGEASRVSCASGYGWDDDGLHNYYDDCQNPVVASYMPWYKRDPAKMRNCDIYKAQAYKYYDNWIEAKVIGMSMYNLELFSWMDKLVTCMATSIMDAVTMPWYFDWMDDAKQWFEDSVLFFMDDSNPEIFKYTMPMGIELGKGDKEDYNNQVNNNYLYVTVTRHKKDKDVGLWKFRYQDLANRDISATAKSHTFQENPGDPTKTKNVQSIRPFSLIGNLASFICGGTSANTMWSDFVSSISDAVSDQSKRHLFETELVTVY